MRFFKSLLLALVLVPAVSHGRTFMTQKQALEAAFPSGTRLVRQPVFLSESQIAEAKKRSGVDFEDALVVRYAGVQGSSVIGYAYFDAHRVRTLPETVMIVLDAAGKIKRMDILSFNEPMEYFPKERWLRQMDGKRLDDQLSLSGSIRPISGATLTGRAIVNASRKILAIHSVIQSDPKWAPFRANSK